MVLPKPNKFPFKVYRCVSFAQVNDNEFTRLLSTASMYVHWPFCKHICPYCNFNKYVSINVDHKRMEKCLRREFKQMVRKSSIRKINTVYFGGGTPSLCEPSTIHNLLNDVAKYCHLKNGSEISLEANPSLHDINRLRCFKDVGINRVSIGVQALNDADLNKLGRDHTAHEAMKFIEEANKIFNGRVSFDLMFGRPGQKLKDWKVELNKALQLGSNHVSLYQLTMERSTPMEKMHRRGEIVLPSSDETADMYHEAVQILKDYGFERYEVANFSREGYESRHNLAYWNGDQYLGAHSRIHSLLPDGLARNAYIQNPVPNNWMKQVEKTGVGVQHSSQLTNLQTLEEIILQGLRSRRGIRQKVFDVFSNHIKFIELKNHGTVTDLIHAGFLHADDDVIKASNTGLALVDSLVPELCLALEKLTCNKATHYTLVET